jgi:hypothetical protein
MADYNEWDDELIATLPGATQDLIDQQVARVVQDFCRKSGAWIVESPLTKIKAGSDTYNFSRISQGKAIHTLSVTVEGKIIPLVDRRPANATAVGNFAYVKTPGIIILHPEPAEDKDEALSVTCSYMPIYDATTLPDEFGTHWYEHILNGVKARMMAMPGKPFSNIQLATYHKTLYISGISEARDEARRRFSTAETSWAFPRWAG